MLMTAMGNLYVGEKGIFIVTIETRHTRTQINDDIYKVPNKNPDSLMCLNVSIF